MNSSLYTKVYLLHGSVGALGANMSIYYNFLFEIFVENLSCQVIVDK